MYIYIYINFCPCRKVVIVPHVRNSMTPTNSCMSQNTGQISGILGGLSQVLREVIQRSKPNVDENGTSLGY